MTLRALLCVVLIGAVVHAQEVLMESVAHLGRGPGRSIATSDRVRHVVTAVFLIIGAATGASAQEVQCDPRIIESAQSAANGYRLRGDRCEGTFKPEVAGPTLWVASFYRSYENFWATPGGELLLTWDSPVDADVFIQAQSVRRQEYYRMDTQVRGAEKSYRWPTALLAVRELGRNDLGVRAWVKVGSQGEVLYLPLRIGEATPATGEVSYTLTVVPNVRLKDVLVSLAPVDSVGEVAVKGFLRRNESLGRPLYVTQQPIDIPIQGIVQRGVYLTEITGIMATGEALPPMRVWFYHPGS